MESVTLPAHFDGDRILLDEPFELEPDTNPIVTVLPKQTEQEAWLQTLREIEERSQFMNPKPNERDWLREGRSGAMYGGVDL